MTKPMDPTMPSASDLAETQVHAEEAYCSACNQSYPAGTLTCPKDGARLIKLAAETDTLIGRVLDQRYEIRSQLGKGGMGSVYRGWQLSVDREVAIKVIHPKLSNDRSAVKRFLREARLASRLSQPNIVNVYDFGQSEGVLYLVMELLRGHTLASELGKGRRLNPKRTVTIASQLCDALEAAHAQGIVHRDLKPSNIVILDDPPGRDLIKVLDFGLAKSLKQDSGSLVTNTDALLGTPLYMAPEQIDGRESDQRADLYSLGCMLYEMLSGRPPFVDNAVSAVLARHMHDTHVELPPHVPVRLRSMIDQLLVKKPEDRLQSAGDVRKILEDVRDSAPVVAIPMSPGMSMDIPDTIPDVSPALAETFAATPVPESQVLDSAPKSRKSTPRIDTSTDQVKRPQPRRVAIFMAIAIVPIAVVALLVVKSMNNRASTGETGGAGNGSVGSSSGSGAPQRLAVPQDAALAHPPPVDATEIDARGASTTPDAGRHRPRVVPPTSKVDAGATEPNIDFYEEKPKN
ncbi:MAG TPA: serine/threonine-protein kinase [Kofleriaceae bacterium]|nr:serine/threonine-protein kinase [Kofleriaceae bacterium]